MVLDTSHLKNSRGVNEECYVLMEVIRNSRSEMGFDCYRCIMGSELHAKTLVNVSARPLCPPVTSAHFPYDHCFITVVLWGTENICSFVSRCSDELCV